MKFIRPSTILDTGAFARASTATFVGSDGLIQSAANNVPRVEYDPVTLACKGYLGEVSRQNTLVYSEQIYNTTYWSTGNALFGSPNYWTCTSSTDVLNIYGGSAGVAKFVRGSLAGALIARQVGLSITPGSWTPSLFVYVPTQAGVTTWQLSFDVGDVESTTSATQTTFDRWVRVTSTALAVAATRTFIDLNIYSDGTAPPAGFVFYTMGAQFEAGSTMTSYIPTTAAAVTRAADTITGSGLIYSNIPETDYAAWVSGATYAMNDRVIRTTTHSVYQRAVAGAGTTPPETDTTNWVRIGPTNRWAPFDEKVGTGASNTGVITYLLKPGRLNGLALLGVVAGKATVSLVVNNETVYTASIDLDSGNAVGNWYEYFYEPIYQQGEVVITDLLDAALFDVPGYSEGILSVTLERPTETVSCGMLVVGIASDVGLTQYGARVSVRDYSKKDADSFGNYTLTVGDFSKRMTADVIVDNDKLDNVVNYLTRYRATNLVWVGSSVYGCTVVYGFLSDWSVQIENATQSRLSQEIEGMT